MRNEKSTKKTDALQNPVLSEIRKNRRELRKRGLTGADLLAVESIAFVQSGRRRSVHIAEVARLTGVTRQAAWRRIVRLEAIGAVFRVGRAVMLNVRGLLRWSADAIAARLEAARLRFQRKKAKVVTPPLLHRVKEVLTSPTEALLTICGTVAENRAALKACYVPVHLRGYRE